MQDECGVAKCRGQKGRAGVTSVSLSPSGRLLFSGTDDGKVLVWDVLYGELSAVLAGHTRHVSAVARSADGVSLASASWDMTVRVWR